MIVRPHGTRDAKSKQMFCRSCLLLFALTASSLAVSEENLSKQLDAASGGNVIVDVDFGTIDLAPGAEGKVRSTSVERSQSFHRPRRATSSSRRPRGASISRCPRAQRSPSSRVCSLRAGRASSIPCKHREVNNETDTVIPSEVEGPRGAILTLSPRDPSTPLRSARND